MSTAERPLLSVVVCTRDRAHALRDVLADLGRQRPPEGGFEVIVVDNGSTDSTADLLAGLAPDGWLRTVAEPEPGLARARNCGWQTARGEYVGYTDDDCRLPLGWLAVAAEVALRERPDLFGGPIEPIFETQPPEWLERRDLTRSRGAEARRLPDGENLWGGNLFIRRELLAELGGFSVHLGMRGRRIAYGEETALQHEIRRRFPDAVVYYEPRLAVEHLERAEKQSLRWLLRKAFAKGRDVYLAAGDAAPRPPRALLVADFVRTAALLAGQALLRTMVRDRRRFPTYRSYLVAGASLYLRRLGRLRAQMGAAR